MQNANDTLFQCQEQCPYGKWGNACRNLCQCKNEGMCDPIDGSCSCKGNGFILLHLLFILEE